ncbi:hypothetical protein ACFYO7_28065 [Nocardia salmonicida]|uniref:hypothetical protein n=1 Tax=Nocardia salmonicida TaxID=53431 RepID=UPI0036AE323A
MTDHLLNDMARMHAYVQKLSEVMQRAQGTVPVKSTGRDSTGAVNVTLDHEGSLVDIVVSERWTQRLDAAGLGTAVIEAVRAADSQRHAATMMALADPGMLESLRRVNPDSAVHHPIEPAPMLSSPTTGEQLSRDVVSELEKAISREMSTRTGQAEVGTEAQAQVTLDARGIVDCSIRVAWGQQVSGSTVAHAIQQAYDNALRVGDARDAAGAPSIGSLIEQTLGQLSMIQNETSGGFR